MDGWIDQINIIRGELEKIVEFHIGGVILRSKIKRYIEGEKKQSSIL